MLFAFGGNASAVLYVEKRKEQNSWILLVVVWGLLTIKDLVPKPYRLS